MIMLILLLIESFFIYKTVRASKRQKAVGAYNGIGSFEWWMILSAMFGVAILVGVCERYLSNVLIPLAILTTILGGVAATVSIREIIKSNSR